MLIINTLHTRFCTSYIGIAYKFLYKQSLYSEIPAVAVPPTCQACQVETDEVIGTEAGMTFGHLDTPQNPHEWPGAQERDQLPLTPHPIVSSMVETTLMRIIIRQNVCIIITVLFMADDIKNIIASLPEQYSGEDDIKVFDTWLNRLLCWFLFSIIWLETIRTLCG